MKFFLLFDRHILFYIFRLNALLSVSRNDQSSSFLKKSIVFGCLMDPSNLLRWIEFDFKDPQVDRRRNTKSRMKVGVWVRMRERGERRVWYRGEG